MFYKKKNKRNVNIHSFLLQFWTLYTLLYLEGKAASLGSASVLCVVTLTQHCVNWRLQEPVTWAEVDFMVGHAPFLTPSNRNDETKRVGVAWLEEALFLATRGCARWVVEMANGSWCDRSQLSVINMLPVWWSGYGKLWLQHNTDVWCYSAEIYVYFK